MSGKDIKNLFKDQKLAAITFSTVDASFAIPLEQVLYIEKDVQRNLQVDELEEFNHGVITFQNNTVQLFDFNKLLGSENYQQTMKALVDKLDDMEQQHKDWVDALEKSLKTNTPFTKALDPNMCAFGQWYSKFQTDNEELTEVLQRFDEPHKKLHGLAKTLLDMNHDNHEEAIKILDQERLSTLAELTHLFHLTKERAHSSIRPIIIFVEHNEGKVTALRLDNINDIVNFEQQNFCKDESAEGILKSKNEDFVIEGFLRDGDSAPLMLINCQPKETEDTANVA